MGLKHNLTFFLLLSVSSPLLAVPRLRLSQTVVGPVTIAQGANAPARSLEIFSVDAAGANSETAALRPTFTSTVPWVTASVGAVRNCERREGQCLPVNLTFSTASLQAGAHSATVTVRDPNALDAPQNILVVVQVGSAIPNSINLFVPPDGSSDTAVFTANSQLLTVAQTQSGGNWLSVVNNTAGSFEFVQSYLVRASHLTGMAEGSYNGTIAISRSNFAGDNKTATVNLRVTSQPIARLPETSIRVRLAQNSTRILRRLLISNRGRGTLTVSGATGSTASGGNWLTVEKVPNFNVVDLNFDAANVAPGVYRGSVEIVSNAVNSPQTLPVELEVVAQGAPVITAGRVVDNAVFQEGEPLAAGGIVAAFGEELSYAAPQGNTSLPLPAELGGIRVFVNDQPAPIFFSSYNQVNFQVPFNVTPGDGRVRIDRGSTRGNTVTARFVAANPKLLRLTLRASGLNIPEARDYFGIAVNSDGSLSLPRDLGIPNSRPSRRGEAIVLYGLGFGATTAAGLREGQASPGDPLPRVASDTNNVYFGALALNSGALTEALYIGLTPGFVGLYQVNVVVPEESPSGEVPVRVQLDTVSSEYAIVTVE